MSTERTGELQSLIVAHDRKVGEALAHFEASRQQLQTRDFIVPHSYDGIQTGTIENIDRIRLQWLRPDLFLYIPKAAEPFAFVRHGGKRIVPRTMITDGGTIPKVLGMFGSGLSPMGYLPAFLVHDWEFESHHCGDITNSFEDVRDTMMEILKTMMETGIVNKNIVTFTTIYAGINSPIARGYWNRDPPSCTLPPDQPE
ncbi:hypothetical protein [Blastochloris tepida]|uniref:DUF1353 domain-containing protein n=1 Tax=Blastochloris tepida TaxID=2233851 RepID=A0A348G0V1_9HYPH|nr:hypothetical protein [Blastochloris tepida]BBF93184.1 hypothetical protein BLTE_18690 [Blastochloris tepida]